MKNLIELYVCTDDRKRIRKAPSKVASATIRLKEPTNIINPIVYISRETVGETFASVNYAYIPDFGRWYFIDSIECRAGGVLAFSLTVDVLYTYKDDLLNTSFMVARSQKKSDPYYIDNERALINRRVVTYKKLGKLTQNATGKKYVITVAGGV